MARDEWVLHTPQTIFGDAYPADRIKTVLDVGCGLSLKSQYVNPNLIVGIDVYRPYLERVETTIPHVLLAADIKTMGELFLPKSFDLVFCFDVLEHLYKPDSERVVMLMETLARVAVVIETPLGFVPQNIDIWGLGGDEYQTHRCSWTPQEFIQREYLTLTRPYTMTNAKRHTTETPDRQIYQINALKVFNG